jgi:hypothetical protein
MTGGSRGRFERPNHENSNHFFDPVPKGAEDESMKDNRHLMTVPACGSVTRNDEFSERVVPGANRTATEE